MAAHTSHYSTGIYSFPAQGTWNETFLKSKFSGPLAGTVCPCHLVPTRHTSSPGYSTSGLRSYGSGATMDSTSEDPPRRLQKVRSPEGEPDSIVRPVE